MFIVLDLETTGLSAKDDSIIECAFVKIDRNTFKEIDRFTSFVNPGKEIPGLISQITNIFNDDVACAPKFSYIEDDIQDFIEGFPLIGHNIPFDIRFLESHGIDTSKNPYIDTFFLANFLCFEEKSLNLWYLCDVFDIKLENAHRAIDDTLATVKVFECLIKKLQKLPKDMWILAYEYFSICRDVGVCTLRDEYLEKPKKNISQDTITDLYLKNIKKHIADIDDMYSCESIENIEEFLSQIPWFELRESQKIMLDKVDNTLSKWWKSLIEAPTWIWKTFAYLLPAIKHSLAFHEPVHISTSTKALQDQIYYKDLQFISDNFPQKFSFSKLKGKRNYLWISSFLEFLDSSENTHSWAISFILKIFFWSMRSELWELDELNFFGEEYGFLSDIHAGNSFIFDEGNIYKEQEFALRARKRAKSSNVIITNNHILFQDIVSEGSLLWWVKNLILDEAHSLEDIVTQSLKKTISFESLQKLLLKIERKILKYKFWWDKIGIKKQQVLFDGAELFSILEWKIFSEFKLDAKYKTTLLSSDFFDDSPDSSLLAKKISDLLEGIKQDIIWIWEKESLKLSSEMQEIVYVRQILSDVFFHTNISKNIYYISHDENRGTQLHTTVLRPWDFLQKHLWKQLESIVLTSATLQMQDNFGYINEVLQVQDFESMILPSDFDYSKQALLFIPQDLWSVKNNLPELIVFFQKFFSLVGGRTLVLFTAFFAIREVYTHLKIELEQKNMHLLAQSISGSKYKQIDFFKKHPKRSILLWTDTFWEWIDIPWEDLQYLLIHKIPFAVPSDPIFKARSKLYKDSFSEYAIPKSILKLKQWFGRLIRTKKDTGIVVFLDDRIYTTRWGESFLHSFPSDIKIRYGASDKLLDILGTNK
jgi:ATP-dependent DNA helicase DinG